MSDEAIKPYAGTSGWSGSQASEERARDEDSSGVTARRQREVLRLVERQGAHGATVKEVRTTLGLHHGQASGPLSVLHKTGVLARLHEKRGRCHVYVHPDFILGRDVDTPGSSHRVNEERDAFIAGYKIASPTEVPDWEAGIAYDLWKREK